MVGTATRGECGNLGWLAPGISNTLSDPILLEQELGDWSIGKGSKFESGSSLLLMGPSNRKFEQQ